MSTFDDELQALKMERAELLAQRDKLNAENASLRLHNYRNLEILTYFLAQHQRRWSKIASLKERVKVPAAPAAGPVAGTEDGAQVIQGLALLCDKLREAQASLDSIGIWEFSNEDDE